jgi:hypothetical protein
MVQVTARVPHRLGIEKLGMRELAVFQAKWFYSVSSIET